MSPWNDNLDDAGLSRPGVEPKPTTAKVIGILNIVFGSLLVLCGLCAGFYVLIFASMGPLMAGQQPQLQKRLEDQKQAEIQRLEDREKAARTEDEKKRIRDQIQAVKARPVKIPDMSKLLGDPRVQGYYVADVVSGLLLNLLLLISGIGLVCLKEWARVTAVWVAALKILRLLALYGFFILVIVPIQTDQFFAFIQDVEKSMPQGARRINREEMAGVGAMLTGYAIGIVVLGLIYPIIALCLLTRPGVKVACTSPRPAPADGPPRSEDGPPY
jgi:hypothetical protein